MLGNLPELILSQLDISDDDFLSLMADDGETKDDVKMPDGEIGDKIKRLFTDEEKDTSKTPCLSRLAKFPLTNLFPF